MRKDRHFKMRDIKFHNNSDQNWRECFYRTEFYLRSVSQNLEIPGKEILNCCFRGKHSKTKRETSPFLSPGENK